MCAEGPVKSPADLTLPAEHRRGHGALYGGPGSGDIDVERPRGLLAGLPLPRFDGGRPGGGSGRVAVAASGRSHAPRSGCSATSTGGRRTTRRSFRGGRTRSSPPSNPAPPPGSRSWMCPAGVRGRRDRRPRGPAARRRPAPGRRRAVAGRDADITIVADAGYDLPRPAWVLRGLPVEVVGRLRNRVLRLPKLPYVYAPWGGRPPNTARSSTSTGRRLARAGRHDVHGHHRLRKGTGPGVGPGAPAADPPLGLARSPRLRRPRVRQLRQLRPRVGDPGHPLHRWLFEKLTTAGSSTPPALLVSSCLPTGAAALTISKWGLIAAFIGVSVDAVCEAHRAGVAVWAGERQLRDYPGLAVLGADWIVARSACDLWQ
ncbi:hypothetical protein O1L68_43590 [Streptomyces lydicus]|nr:hypothetical protein [Streptomyces lydicus]